MKRLSEETKARRRRQYYLSLRYKMFNILIQVAMMEIEKEKLK